jgi:hypothetical protein
MGMKKFNSWYNEAIGELSSESEPIDIKSKTSDPEESKPSSSVSSLGSIKTYADIAAKRGEKRTFNYDQVEALFKTFLSQFQKPSEQRLLVNMLRQKMVRPYEMFDQFKK